MWFHLEPKGKGYTGALSGIATANKITGPYTFIRSTRTTPGCYPVNVLDLHKCPVKQSTIDKKLYGGGLNGEHPDTLNILGRDFKEGQMARDMQLFVDDNGKAYHIFASETNSTIHIAELTDDFLDYTGKYVRAFVNRYMEAPAISKRTDYIILWVLVVPDGNLMQRVVLSLLPYGDHGQNWAILAKGKIAKPLFTRKVLISFQCPVEKMSSYISETVGILKMPLMGDTYGYLLIFKITDSIFIGITNGT